MCALDPSVRKSSGKLTGLVIPRTVTSARAVNRPPPAACRDFSSKRMTG